MDRVITWMLPYIQGRCGVQITSKAALHTSDGTINLERSYFMPAGVIVTPDYNRAQEIIMAKIETDQQKKDIRSALERKTANMLLQMWLQSVARLYALQNATNEPIQSEIDYRKKEIDVIETEMFRRNVEIVWSESGFIWQFRADDVGDIPF